MIEIYGCRYVKSMPPKVFVYFWRAKLLLPMTSWPIRFYWVATQYNKWLEGIHKDIAVNNLTYDGATVFYIHHDADRPSDQKQLPQEWLSFWLVY